MKEKRTIHWIWEKARGQAVRLILLSLFSMVASGAYVFPALLSRRAINAAVGAASLKEAAPVLLECALLLLLVILIQLLLSVINTHLRAVISGKMEKSMRESFFSSLLKKEYAAISRYHSGEILNRFTSDIDIVVSGITTFLPQALSILTKLLAGLVLIISFSPGFALVSIGIGVLVLFFALLFRPFYKKMHKMVQEAAGKARSFTQECTESLAVIKSFCGKTTIRSRLSALLETVYRTKIRRNHVSNFTSNGVSLLFTLFYYATLIWGALSIAGGHMDYGTLTAFLQIVSQIQSPFLTASGLISSVYSALASAERLMEIEQLPFEKTDKGFDVGTAYEAAEGIRAHALAFRYDARPIIQSGDFFLPKGSLTAITGTSGTGKSTLFRLLLGLYTPNAGTLSLQTADGEILLDASTRALFAYVPQGNFLLSGTIRENIKFINPAISDAKMEEAARAACIYDFISRLPDGFDTVLGERGSGLSEGQMQRIAIARALCADAPVLLLDECTSALDSETEEAVLRNIAALKTKTVLFISHKNAAFSFCDTHLSIDDGVFRLI